MFISAKSRLELSSIKTKLILWQISLVIVITATIGITSYFIVSMHITGIQKERQKASIQALAIFSRNFIEESKNQLITIASADPAAKYHKSHNPLVLQAHFSKHSSRFPIITYVNDNGDEEVKNLQGDVSFNYVTLSDSPFYQKVKQLPNKVHVSPLRYSDLLDDYVVDFAYQYVDYFDDNLGFFKASVPVSRLHDKLKDLGLGETGFYIIIDNTGRILTSTHKNKTGTQIENDPDISIELVNRIKKQQSISGGGYALFGEDCIVSMLPITEYNWQVISVFPEREFFALIYTLRNNIGLATLVILILGVFLAYLIGRSITNPVIFLENVVSKISKDNDLSQRAVLTSNNEVGRLAKSFNQMLVQIENGQHEIINTKNYLNNIIHTMTEFLIVTDIKGQMKMVNKTVLDFLENTEEEFLGRDLNTFIFENGHGAFRKKEIEKLIELDSIQFSERTLMTKGGITVPLSISASVMRDGVGGVQGIVFVARNNTDRIIAEEKRLQLEEELQQSQKMEALGTLTGGIAHDFNNILGALLGFTELALPLSADNDELRDYLTYINRSGERAQKLVQQMMTFSRSKKPDLKPLAVASVIEESMQMLRSWISTTIDIDQEIDLNCHPILGDETQILQVVVNLCTNAFHAMEESGGKLIIRLEEAAYDELDNPQADSGPGTYIKLSVTDTGCGMSPEIMQSIYNPFFSTKEPGKGTGLGLSVVQGIVQNHTGTINCLSEEGKGTTFELLFPVYEGEIIAESLEETTDKTGDEHIMVVDDEESFAQFLETALKKQGYQITRFNDVKLALEAFGAQPDRFDLVITDLTMPKMTGTRLAQELHKIRSEIPIILTSGHDTTASLEQAKATSIQRVIAKPFKIRELSVIIRDIFDKAS